MYVVHTTSDQINVALESSLSAAAALQRVRNVRTHALSPPQSYSLLLLLFEVVLLLLFVYEITPSFHFLQSAAFFMITKMMMCSYIIIHTCCPYSYMHINTRTAYEASRYSCSYDVDGYIL